MAWLINDIGDKYKSDVGPQLIDTLKLQSTLQYMPVEYSPPTYSLGANALGLDAGQAQEEAPQVVVTWLEAPQTSRHRSKSRSKSRRPTKSKSPHRTPISIVQALVEERRQASEISALEARLAAETRRADEAVSRAQYAERREKEALAAIAESDTRRVKMEQEIVAIESSSRDYQVQLELTARELRLSRRDGELLQAEFDQLARSHKDVQEQCRKYQTALKASQARIESRETVMQNSMRKWFVNGEGVGYDNGYQDGYEEGRDRKSVV